MSTDNDNGNEFAEFERFKTSESEKNKARKWFERAKQLLESRNYDYAIKCYIDGLNLWPDAVVEGHQPLRAAAKGRQFAGGKKAGIKDSLKHSMSGKDAKKAMLNAEYLWSQDPTNLSYMEGIVKNANKSHCDDTLDWIADIFREAILDDKKPSAKQLDLLATALDELGERALKRNETELAMRSLERAIQALSDAKRINPKETDIPNRIRDMSTRLTIVKGRYQSGDSYRDSMRDEDQQKDFYDRDRMVQSGERMDELIAKSMREYEANPDDPVYLGKLVDALVKSEREQNENEAIKILLDAYKRTDNYSSKSRADEIRIRQMNRQARTLLKGGDRDGAIAYKKKQLKHEIAIYEERAKHYPTDARIKFEWGRRLFQGGLHDDAIPVLQAARSDPKHRYQCLLYLGRCFFSKSYFSQARDTLEDALERYETPDDDVGKELAYWLGRSQESEGLVDDSKKTYGQLLQIDYNYRDVRDRLDQLKSDDSTSA
jgi:tetratricopeptide (TPR) repeat protein